MRNMLLLYVPQSVLGIVGTTSNPTRAHPAIYACRCTGQAFGPGLECTCYVSAECVPFGKGECSDYTEHYGVRCWLPATLEQLLRCSSCLGLQAQCIMLLCLHALLINEGSSYYS